MSVNSIVKLVSDNHSVMLRDDGRVLVWGDNTYGQLGIGAGAPTKVNTPTENTFFADNGLKIKDILVVEDASIVLCTNGEAYSFGKGLNGRLGLGSTTNVSTPTLITGRQTLRFEKLYGGKEFILALTGNNELYGWGRNNYGQVGNNTKVDVLAPTLVMSDADILYLKTGGDFAFLIKQDKSAWVWGNNSGGRYGFDTPDVSKSSVMVSHTACNHSNSAAVAPACTHKHEGLGCYTATYSCPSLLADTETAYLGIKGESKLSIIMNTFIEPTKIAAGAGRTFTELSSLASTWSPSGTNNGVTNNLYKFKSTYTYSHNHSRTWREYSTYECQVTAPATKSGNASTYTCTWQYTLPNAFEYFDTGKTNQIHLGSRHGIAYIDGKYYGWGDNSLKQQGTSGNANGYMVPLTQINNYITQLESGEGFASLHVEGVTNYIISGTGNVSVWGSNANGKAGLGSAASYIENPTVITALNGKATAQIIPSRNGVYALTHTGGLYYWGDNLYGQSGLGEAYEDEIKIATPMFVDGSLFNKIPPAISGEDIDLGDLTEMGLTYACTISHLKDAHIDVVADLNGKIVETVSVANGAEYIFELTGDAWARVFNGKNQKFTITATDSYGESSRRVLTFSKNQTELEFTLARPVESGEKPYRMVLFLTAQIPITGCEVFIEACNNAFDSTPAWEDITAHVTNRRAYIFENTARETDKWGVDLRVSIKRQNAPGDCYISGFTYAFETESGSVQAMSAKLESNEQLMDVLLTEIIPGMMGGECI